MTRLSRAQVVGGLLIAVTVIAVVMGLILAGSPAKERARRLDERRVQDLTSIGQAIDLYWTRHARLPSSLEELQGEPGGKVGVSDPSTNVAYEYRPLDNGEYELCAQFQRDSSEAGQVTRDGFWSHNAGRQCFRRDARTIR